jgi:hypothetical protein
MSSPPQACAPCGKKSDKKVSVCHNGHTICISENALQAHLDHGDVCGPCITQSATASEEIGAPNAAPVMLEKAGAVYPNPTLGIFNVAIPASPFSDIQILISDFSGKTIDRRTVKANSQQQVITFDYSQKSKGIYFIKVIGKTTASPRKLIIK